MESSGIDMVSLTELEVQLYTITTDHAIGMSMEYVTEMMAQQ
jgi:hypothetical protein